MLLRTYVFVVRRTAAVSSLLAVCLTILAQKSSAQQVTPVDWSRFQSPTEVTPFYQGVRTFLNNNARYNLNWVVNQYSSVASNETSTGHRFDIVTGNEAEIRSLAHIAYGLSAMLKNGVYDATESQLSQQTIRDRTIEMIHGAAYEHRANNNGVKWGNVWQSALWTACLSEGAWMMWDDLPASTQAYVRNMTVYEANRFVNYNVPYWANPDGSKNYQGDTKAEENAWNGRILSVAVAMMPDHPNSAAWRQKASELWVSSYARPSDLENSAVIDGQTVAEWLNGYNAHETGFVENHGRIHNDYMAAIELVMYPRITQSLANQASSQAAGFNFPVVYNALTNEPVGSQSKPMFQRSADGGYVAEQYYPQGTDWSPYRYDIFLEMDAFADALELDAGQKYDAAGWAEVRLARMLEMQERHPDGKLYAPGEFDTWAGREGYAMEVMTRVWMMNWLDKQDALTGQSDWNDSLAPQQAAYLRLRINRETGEATVYNSADLTEVELSAYSIRSVGGALDPVAWQRLGAQAPGDWLPANPQHSQLGELGVGAPLAMPVGAARSLGAIYRPATPTYFGEKLTGDVTFEYVNSAGEIIVGDVRYIGVERNRTLLLVVDPSTGEAELRNETPFAVSLEGYIVSSAAAQLTPNKGNWQSLDDQGIDQGTWIEANPSTTQIAELNTVGGTLLQPGETLKLGQIVAPGGPADLAFRFLYNGVAQPMSGEVIFEPIDLPGDFNADGQVDGADFLAWQRGFGATGANLPADANGDGTVDGRDLIVWREDFGASPQLAAAAAEALLPVPEPSAMLIAIVSASGFVLLVR